ncbi:MAG: hypothetical protein ACXU95_06435 [Isosphaeraceae bacterium]
MDRQRWLIIALVFGCFCGLFLLCFGAALWGGGQFGYRDAGHFYYPLYQRVQAEWQQGRWPLWEPEENSGIPLLGNPTAAVLYPGKLIYALLPYAWAARLYIMAHVALAFGAMLRAMRSWQVSWLGSGLAALTYTFGAPVLFQYCNVVFLVGAAWLPLGFLAVDRWVRLGSRPALLGLAIVLAMQTLGGDPQSAYLLGLCGCGYAVGVAWYRARKVNGQEDEGTVQSGRKGYSWWLISAVVIGLALWVAGTVFLAELFPKLRPQGKPPPALPWMVYVPRGVLIAWGMMGLALLERWRRQRWRSPLGWMLLGLVGSGALAAALAAAQLLPVLEFTQATSRAAGEGPHDIYPFSIEPQRLAELVWPSVFGISFGRNAYWVDAAQIPGIRQTIWVPSLYIGCLALILAVAALRFRRGPARQVWLSVIVTVSLVGSLGQYTSPIWAARLLAQTTAIAIPDIGPLEIVDVTPIRLDRYLRDGDGSLYWWMTTVLPGFRQFRYPAKLFTFTTFGLAALAGMGWDALRAGRNRGTLVLAGFLWVLSLSLLTIVLTQREPIMSAMAAKKIQSSFGPLDPLAGFHELVRALAHGAVVLALALILIPLADRRPVLAGPVVLVVVAADLAVANARYVITVPQALFEDEPEVVRIINEAERQNPSPGPFRVHRMPIWNPPRWYSDSSRNPARDFVTWERGTIQPKYGITLGIEYTHTQGVAELFDYEWFFAGFPRTIREPVARALGAKAGQQVVYFPRRSFDMWTTRYFVLPVYPNGWMDEYRGYAAFLDETELIYPSLLQGRDREAEQKAWAESHDYQIRRNRLVYPRAWVVHDSRPLPDLEGLTRLQQGGPMQEILYSDDRIWHDSTLTAFDPRQLVWIEKDKQVELRAFLSGKPPRSTETVKVSYPSPQRVELEANLESAGIVVLADIHYPGWKLTIDGQPAPIYKVNRLMRGAAVPAGVHRLVYNYEPRSFQVGGTITLAGLAAAAVFAVYCALRPRARTVSTGSAESRSEETSG